MDVFTITFTTRHYVSGKTGGMGLDWNIRTPPVALDWLNRRAARSGDNRCFCLSAIQNYNQPIVGTITFTTRPCGSGNNGGAGFD
ncbi:MAG: hypothetical protein HQ591_09835 [candidate division Zixibacteria bacterium]|nr:hypothetical protein [Candidatus Tariuqbacter arcticus]